MPPTENQLELLELPPEAQPFNGETPENLVFDDEPIDHLLYGATPVEPTPVNPLEMWKRNIDRSPACARAIATTVAKNLEDLSAADLEIAEQCMLSTINSDNLAEELQVARCYIGLARLYEIKNKMKEVEHCYRQALKIYEKKLGLGDEETYETGMKLVRLLKKTKREEQAEALSIRLEWGMLEGKEDEHNLLQSRYLALRMFVAGQYAQAETIYRHLLVKHFEAPTNHCHLARVLLMTDRIDEARGEVNQAWDIRETGPDYVIPRIHFLKTLLQMLVGDDWKTPLADLKQELAEPGKEADWTIQRVLVHLKPRLEPELYDLMTKIVGAICDRAKLPELDSCEVWKNIVVASQTSAPPDTKPGDCPF